MALIKKDEWIAKDIKFQLFSSNQNVLTSERQLAEKYNVSRNTIRDSLKILMNQGIIAKENNRYIPTGSKYDFDTEDILGINNKKIITNKIISISELEADKKTANMIQQPLGTSLKIIKYLRYIEKKLISYDVIIIPANLLSDDSWKLSSISAIDLVRNKANTHFTKEYQQLSIKKLPVDLKKESISNQSEFLTRQSLFLTDNPNIFVHLTSYKVLNYALLTQPNNDIKLKVGGFIE